MARVNPAAGAILLRATLAQLARWREAARRDSRSLSAWLRNVADKAATKGNPK